MMKQLKPTILLLTLSLGIVAVAGIYQTVEAQTKRRQALCAVYFVRALIMTLFALRQVSLSPARVVPIFIFPLTSAVLQIALARDFAARFDFNKPISQFVIAVSCAWMALLIAMTFRHAVFSQPVAMVLDRVCRQFKSKTSGWFL